MKKRNGYSFLIFLLLFCCIQLGNLTAYSQNRVADTTGAVVISADTVVPAKKKQAEPFDPRKATIRSAILPGWGQIYNKKYWKLPIVYGALGITSYIFIDNIKTYRESRDAYRIRYNYSLPTATPGDTVAYNNLEEIYRLVSPESIRRQRDKFRQYIDYSIIFFVIFWGLNVVDATVDAHLKNFDVSPDLSFKIKAGHSQLGGTNGLSLVLTIGKTKPATPTWRSQF